VLLFAATTLSTDEEEDGEDGGNARVVLQYSNNAFGVYAPSNPYALALSAAYSAPPAVAGAPAAQRAAAPIPASAAAMTSAAPAAPPLLKRGVSSYLTPLTAAVGHLHPSQASASASASASQASARLPIGTGGVGGPQPSPSEREWAAQHDRALAVCPPAIRPRLVLGAGEAVLSVSFSGGRERSRQRRGRRGLHGATTRD
jgi:hypothetical protein